MDQQERNNENFQQWCGNIGGELEDDGDRLICNFPRDAGYAGYDGEHLYVHDESGSHVNVSTSGHTVRTESGPFRNDRTHPPREKQVRVRDMDEIYQPETIEVSDGVLEATAGPEDMRVSVFDQKEAVRQKFRDTFGSMTPEERREALEKVDQRDRRHIESALDDEGFDY